MWWHECNSRTFEGVKHPSHVVKKYRLGCLYEWMTALGSIHSCHFFKKICRLLKHEFNPLGVVLYAFLCVQTATFVLMKLFLLHQKSGVGELLSLVFSLVKILWVIPKTVVEFWKGNFGRWCLYS